MPDGHESLSWCDLCSDSGLNYSKIKEMSWVQEGVQREQSAESKLDGKSSFLERHQTFVFVLKDLLLIQTQ